MTDLQPQWTHCETDHPESDCPPSTTTTVASSPTTTSTTMAPSTTTTTVVKWHDCGKSGNPPLPVPVGKPCPTGWVDIVPNPVPVYVPSRPPTVLTPPASVEAPTTTVVVCQEDEACWDCTTMGNHICGPQQPVEAAPKPTVLVAHTAVPTKSQLPQTGASPWAISGTGLALVFLGALCVRKAKQHRKEATA